MSDEIKAVDYYTDPDKTVERLKETAERLWDNGAQSVCLDAAGLITRLQAENAELRGHVASQPLADALLEASRSSPQEAGEPVAWPISVDGPHKITDQRAWLARQLMDSKNSDGEAFGIVAYHPAIRDARPAPATNDCEAAYREGFRDCERALDAAQMKELRDSLLASPPPANDRTKALGEALKGLEAEAAALRRTTLSSWDQGKANGLMEAVEKIEAALTPSDQPVKGDDRGG